jgi:hypothetical protein
MTLSVIYPYPWVISGDLIDARTTAARTFDVQPAATGPKAKIPNHDRNPLQGAARMIATLAIGIALDEVVNG